MSRHRVKIHLIGRRVDGLAMVPNVLNARRDPRMAERSGLSTDEDLLQVNRAVCAIEPTTLVPVVNSLRSNCVKYLAENYEGQV